MPLNARLTKFISISRNGDTVGYATDFEISINKEVIDITTLSAQGWKEKLVDMKEWKVSVNGLVTYGTPDANEIGSEDLLASIIDDDTPATLLISSGISGDSTKTGDAFLVSYAETGTVNDKMTFSAEFEGTGALDDAPVV